MKKQLTGFTLCALLLALCLSDRLTIPQSVLYRADKVSKSVTSER